MRALGYHWVGLLPVLDDVAGTTGSMVTLVAHRETKETLPEDIVEHSTSACLMEPLTPIRFDRSASCF